MGFCTSLFFPSGIETEILSASIAELKGVLVQNRVTDLTGMGLHSLKRIRVRGVKGSWVQEFLILNISLRWSVIVP